MKRVVVTGLGIVSSIGNNQQEVVESLKEGRSGIGFSEVYKEMGLRSHIEGSINIELDDVIDRKVRRFMGDGAAFNYVAMQQAIDDSGLSEDEISKRRIFCVKKALSK
jgi:3-oxoacyl-[acyl-carrier-protein] synthase I